MKIPYGEFSYASLRGGKGHTPDAHLAGRFPRVLQAMELRVYPGGGEELGVPSGLGDTRTASQHDDAVGPLDGGEPMRDHEGCAAFHESFERLLDVALDSLSRAEVASSRISTGEFLRNARAMASRCRCPPEEAHAVLPDHGIEALCHFADELHRVRRLGGLKRRRSGSFRRGDHRRCSLRPCR